MAKQSIFFLFYQRNIFAWGIIGNANDAFIDLSY